MIFITGPNVPAMLEAYNANAVVYYPHFSPLHMAAFLRIPTLVELLITQATQWVKESGQQGRNTCSLGSIVDSDSAFGNTIIRWTLDWKQPDLLRQMVRMPKFNEQLARRQFGGRIEKYLSDESDGDDDDYNDDAKDDNNEDDGLQQLTRQRRRMLPIFGKFDD